jgi:transposase
MIGPRQVAQDAPFYELSIKGHVSPGHLLRGLDRFVDLCEKRRCIAPLCSTTGKPALYLRFMIRILIVGCVFGIRCKQRLCEEAHLNLAYRWFCRLSLRNPVPGC